MVCCQLLCIVVLWCGMVWCVVVVVCCVCVVYVLCMWCVCGVLSVVCCPIVKHPKKTNIDNITGEEHGDSSVDKYQKTQKMGKLSKHGLRFGTIWSSMDPKKRPKTVFFPYTLFFLHVSWDLPTFSAESPFSNA